MRRSEKATHTLSSNSSSPQTNIFFFFFAFNCRVAYRVHLHIYTLSLYTHTYTHTHTHTYITDRISLVMHRIHSIIDVHTHHIQVHTHVRSSLSRPSRARCRPFGQRGVAMMRRRGRSDGGRSDTHEDTGGGRVVAAGAEGTVRVVNGQQQTAGDASGNMGRGGSTLQQQQGQQQGQGPRPVEKDVCRYLCVKLSWKGRYRRIVCVTPTSIRTLDPNDLSVTNSWSLANELAGVGTEHDDVIVLHLKQPGKSGTKQIKFATKQRARLIADLHIVLRLTTPEHVAALFAAPVVINCARLRSRGRWQMVRAYIERWIYIYPYIWMCVCALDVVTVYAPGHTHTHTHTHTYIHTSTRIHMCMHVGEVNVCGASIYLRRVYVTHYRRPKCTLVSLPFPTYCPRERPGMDV